MIQGITTNPYLRNPTENIFRPIHSEMNNAYQEVRTFVINNLALFTLANGLKFTVIAAHFMVFPQHVFMGLLTGFIFDAKVRETSEKVEAFLFADRHPFFKVLLGVGGLLFFIYQMPISNLMLTYYFSTQGGAWIARRYTPPAIPLI